MAKLQSRLGLPWTAIHHLGKLPPGLPSTLLPPGLPSTTLASYPLDCHRSLRIFWRGCVPSTIDRDLQNAHSKPSTAPKSHNTIHPVPLQPPMTTSRKSRCTKTRPIRKISPSLFFNNCPFSQSNCEVNWFPRCSIP